MTMNFSTCNYLGWQIPRNARDYDVTSTIPFRVFLRTISGYLSLSYRNHVTVGLSKLRTYIYFNLPTNNAFDSDWFFQIDNQRGLLGSLLLITFQSQLMCNYFSTIASTSTPLARYPCASLSFTILLDHKGYRDVWNGVFMRSSSSAFVIGIIPFLRRHNVIQWQCLQPIWHIIQQVEKHVSPLNDVVYFERCSLYICRMVLTSERKIMVVTSRR